MAIFAFVAIFLILLNSSKNVAIHDSFSAELFTKVAILIIVDCFRASVIGVDVSISTLITFVGFLIVLFITVASWPFKWLTLTSIIVNDELLSDATFHASIAL